MKKASRINVKRMPRAKTGPADPRFLLEDYVLYNLVRTVDTYNEEMAKALKSHGLDIMKWRVLMLLHDKSPSSVGELARRSVTKTPTLTRVLDRMERDGLVLRQALSDDRRVVQVVMTPKAATALRTVQEIGQRVFERAFEGIKPAEIASMTQTLKRVRGNLNRSYYETAEAPDETGGLAAGSAAKRARAS